MRRADLLDDDRVVLAFSGGKDNLACLLHLLELGVSPERISVYPLCGASPRKPPSVRPRFARRPT